MSEYGWGERENDYGGDDRRETGESLFEVQLCSGEQLLVQTDQEQRWFNATKGKYLTENKFDAVTDAQDLDRLLVLELALFRWTQHLASGRDYENNLIDEDLNRKQIKEQSDVINKLKVQLGLDKRARDAALAEGNFHTWFSEAKRRAGLFRVHRENQLRRALALINELSGIVNTFDRCDEEERRKLGWETEKDIVDWVRSQMMPKFHELDAYFVENEQRYWKKDL